MSEIELTKRERTLIRHGLICGVVLGFLLGFFLCLSIFNLGAIIG